MILHRPTKLHLNRTNLAKLWRHIDFQRWQPSSHKYTSGFGFTVGTCLRRSKSIWRPNFDDISIHRGYSTTSGFGKQTSAIFEFNFWFQFWPMCHHCRVIVYRSTTLQSNQTKSESYDVIEILKLAAMASQIYFRLRFMWRHLFQQVEVYLQTKFWWDNSSTVEILLRLFWENKQSPYWNSTSGFDYDLFVVSASHFTGLPNFIQIKPYPAVLWRHVDSSRWRPRQCKSTSGFAFSDVTLYEGWNHLQVKFRWDISIHGWDIITSVFEKQMAAILELYFRFAICSRISLWDNGLYMYKSTKFRLHVSIPAKVTNLTRIAYSLSDVQICIHPDGETDRQNRQKL